MIIQTTKPQEIAGKQFGVNCQLEVTNDLGKRLVKEGFAWCMDGTYTVRQIEVIHENKTATVDAAVTYISKRKKIT